MDNCCGCGQKGCPACLGNVVGATLIGTWQPTGAGYEEHVFIGAGQAGRYILAYCGGAFGHTLLVQQDLTNPPFTNLNFPSTLGEQLFCSVWETLVFNQTEHAWVNPQWLPPYNVFALRYGSNKTDAVDANFGQGSGGLSVSYLGNYPPLSGIPFFGGEHWVADGTPWVHDPAIPIYPPGAQFAGVGNNSGASNAKDQAAAVLAEQRCASAFPLTVGGCPAYQFDSDGSFPVRMQFTAPLYTGDSWPTGFGVGRGPNFMIKTEANGGPKFALLQKVPSQSLMAGTSCGTPNFGTPNQYFITLTIKNVAGYSWFVNASLGGAGVQVLNGNGQVFTIPPAVGPNTPSTVNITFLVQATTLNGITVTLTLNDDVGKVIDLNYNLTPLLTGFTVESQGTSFEDLSRNRILLQFNSNGGPWNNLQVHVTSPDISGIFDAGLVDNGQQFPGNLFDNTVVGGFATTLTCTQTQDIQVIFDIGLLTTRPGSVTLTFSFLDSGVPSAVPPFTQTVALAWT